MVGLSQQQRLLHIRSPVCGSIVPKHITSGHKNCWATGAPSAERANRASEVKRRLVGFMMAE